VARATPRASEADRLIADLQSVEAVRRDAAVARLRVLGVRALPHLAKFIESSADASARALAIGALDGIEDPHAVEISLKALETADVVTTVAALGVLRNWVAQETGTRLLETITAIAVDRTRDTRVRVAAIEALSELPDDLVGPIRAQGPPPEDTGPPLDNPAAAHEWVEAHGGHATLARLHDSIKAFRDAEGCAETSRGRDEWVRARGAAHRILADRGSRIALYDARETLMDATASLPPGFVEAIGQLGDATCLEPLARAWSLSRDASWRAQLSDAAQQIVTRAKLGGRNAVVRGIRASWTGFI
jgi:HEAT repeat protein